MNTRSNQTVLVVVLAGVAFLIGAAGAMLLVMPQRSKIDKLNHQISAAQTQLASAQPHATHAPTVKPGAADLFRLMEAMPDTDQMPTILIGLSRIAKDSSVGITSLDPQPLVQLQGYAALPITMVIHGKYEDVTAFLRRLRTAVAAPNGHLQVSGRLFITNQVQMTSSDGRLVSATLNLDAFDYGGTLPTPTTTTSTDGSSTSTASTTTTTTARS